MLDRAQRRSALAEIGQPGAFGPDLKGGPGIRLAERRGLAIVELQAWPDTQDTVRRDVGSALGVEIPRARDGSVARRNGTAAIAIGPERWLVVEREGRDLYGLVRDAVGDRDAAVTDQSHGRVVLRLGGRDVRDLLAKGSSLDLRPRRFAPGRAATTRLEHFAVLLHCLEDDLFDLFVLRSYAVSLYEWVLDAALEFGCRVEPPIEG